MPSCSRAASAFRSGATERAARKPRLRYWSATVPEGQSYAA
jgi:hypothetical protein